MNEKRMHARYKPVQPIKVTCDEWDAEIVNISREGIKIRQEGKLGIHRDRKKDLVLTHQSQSFSLSPFCKLRWFNYDGEKTEAGFHLTELEDVVEKWYEEFLEDLRNS